MQIKLTQADLLKAISLFVMAQGINLAGKDLAVTFTSGRKDKGTTADLSITDVGVSGLTLVPAPFQLQASTEVLVNEVGIPEPEAEPQESTVVAEAPAVEVETQPEVVVETPAVAAESLFTTPAVVEAPAIALSAHDTALIASLPSQAEAPALKSLFGNG